MRKISETTGKPVSVGALYSALDRMERKGYIRSHLGEATKERGGRAKRFIELNPSGRQALREEARYLDQLTSSTELIRAY